LLLYFVLDLRIGERLVAEVLDCSAGTFAYSRRLKVEKSLGEERKTPQCLIF